MVDNLTNSSLSIIFLMKRHVREIPIISFFGEVPAKVLNTSISSTVCDYIPLCSLITNMKAGSDAIACLRHPWDISDVQRLLQFVDTPVVRLEATISR